MYSHDNSTYTQPLIPSSYSFLTVLLHLQPGDTMCYNECGMMHLGHRRLPWGEGLLGLAPTQEERSPVTGQLLFRGLSAKVGIFHGPIVKLCPHSTTGLPHSHHDTPLITLPSFCRLPNCCAAVRRSVWGCMGGMQSGVLPSPIHASASPNALYTSSSDYQTTTFQNQP